MLPLNGIRVLDNGIVQAGTFPARLLADFGAEVVRVENYRSPDLSRNLTFTGGVPGDPYWESGGTYHEQHRNKESCVGLDVRTVEGREFYLRLVEHSDIVLDSHPPGVMDKLGLAWDAVRAANPRAIYITSSGYGYGGPYSTARSYGMMTEIMCGSGWLNGYEGEGPRRGQVPLTDHPAVFHGAFLAMAALIQRRRTGEGMWLDISQYEVAVNVFGDAHLANAMGAPVASRIGSTEPGAPFSGCFRCDGPDAWVAVVVESQRAWDALAALVGMPMLGRKDAAQALSAAERDEAGAAITAWTSHRTKQAAFADLVAAGITASPVNNHRDLLLDPHLAERGFFWLVDHAPEQNAGRRAWPGLTARLERTPGELRARAPMLGEHNRKIATELLGYSTGEYDELERVGAVGTIPRAATAQLPTIDLAARAALPAGHRARSKEFDARWIERLRQRFGPDYGPAPAVGGD
jgi:crotonobetainyl-CoA:carnitine CoA-transferase CaiB-like acyl-CoA transferase